MKIDGRGIANQICADLKERVGELQRNGITPHLAVILVGSDPASEVYVLQKSKRGESINAEIEVLKYPESVAVQTLLEKIGELNTNPQIHGIIIQRPLPPHINPDIVAQEVRDVKDVDGFKPESPFHVPILLATLRVLQEIYSNQNDQNDSFLSWLKSKKIVLVGKGSTAGKPILDYFKETGIQFQLIDSRTENPQNILREADIVISAVGKQNFIKPENLKNGVSLVGIGINKNQGQLHGDYDEEKIKDIVSFYTPTPGGLGPINVAMLLENLVMAAETQTQPLNN